MGASASPIVAPIVDSSTLSVSSCRTSRARDGPECHAEAQFVSARDAAGQEQIPNVGTRNQEHERDDGENDEKGWVEPLTEHRHTETRRARARADPGESPAVASLASPPLALVAARRGGPRSRLGQRRPVFNRTITFNHGVSSSNGVLVN